nr:hypothetical protein Itr_chr04CG19830 [Ipomoea trifida]
MSLSASLRWMALLMSSTPRRKSGLSQIASSPCVKVGSTSTCSGTGTVGATWLQTPCNFWVAPTTCLRLSSATKSHATTSTTWTDSNTNMATSLAFSITRPTDVYNIKDNTLDISEHQKP